MAATNSSLTDPVAIAAGDLTRDAGLARIIKVDTSTGCTLTNASIKGLTPAEFEALSNKEIDLARVIASSAEAKMLGVQERGMVSLLNSSIQNIKPLINKVNVAEQSLILPYIQRRQRSVINANYFAFDTGVHSQSAGSGILSAPYVADGSDWEVQCNLGGSDWVQPIDHLERYFIPGAYVIVHHVDGSNNLLEVQYKIVGAANADAGGIAVAKVTLRPTGQQIAGNQDQTKGGYATKELFDAETFAADYTPVQGVLQTIANNVNDFEDWCRNQPTDLSVKLIVNWLQTTRESRTVDESYKETLQKVMSGDVNPFLSSMVYQPLAEQNKIASQISQDQWVRGTWYNQALSEKQMPETYMELPNVTDPEDATCTLEYKANALGIKALLREAGRVKDNLGATLNLDNLFSDLYFLKRNREQDGTAVGVIDCMTDRFTYNLFYEKMNTYYKDRYGWEIHRNAELNQTITHDGIILFNYSLYDVPEVGVQLAMFHDPYFDDIATVGTGNKWLDTGVRSTDNVFSDDGADWEKAARTLWFVDWSDVKIGIAGTNAVTRKQPHPEIDRLYKCRMDATVKEYSLRSTKWTTMMDVPARHLIIENFDLAVSSTHFA